MSKRYDKHFKKGAWCDNCFVYIYLYGKMREKFCDFSCFKTDKPCRNYENAHWEIKRCQHYFKVKPKFPTTLKAWKNRYKPHYKR